MQKSKFNKKQELYYRWLIQDKYSGVINKQKLKNDFRRLKKGEPIDYIIGWKPFLGCKIDLSFRPFIPRLETEYWAEIAIAQIKKLMAKDGGLRIKDVRVLDLFSGSGAIGIAVLKNSPKVRVDFGEINPKFIKQIKKNFKLNKVPV